MPRLPASAAKPVTDPELRALKAISMTAEGAYAKAVASITSLLMQFTADIHDLLSLIVHVRRQWTDVTHEATHASALHEMTFP